MDILLPIDQSPEQRRKSVLSYLEALDVRTPLKGVGDPEGVVEADIGTLYTRTDGGTGTTLYVKEADDGLDTGWVAK
jgi:hypothetical protein